MIRDQAVVFGRFHGLVGVVSESVEESAGAATANPPAASLPAIVLINTGVTHRVGANRMGTIWSHRLARAGHRVLRFDMSGIGDSERRGDTLAPAEAALADIRDAVDWLLAARGIDRVILVGLCSGADLALLYAGGDPRIVGAVLIDPSIPPTWRFYLIHLRRKLAEWDTWRRLPRIALNILRLRRARARDMLPSDAWKYGPIPLNDPKVRAILTEAYRAAFASDARMLAVFTAGVVFQHNYRDQLIEALPDICFGDRLRLEFFERCDHLFTQAANRARLFDATAAWLASTMFKPGPAAPGRPGDRPAPSASTSEDFLDVEF